MRSGGIHPYSLQGVITNPLARMLPKGGNQRLAYRLGEKVPPPGTMAGHGPFWAVAPFVLSALATSQARINLQRDFHLLAIMTQASLVTAAGGFRAQLYDTRKKLRLADRGELQALLGGTAQGGGPNFLREPYIFDEPDSQLLVIVQNMESSSNTIQIAFYGQVLRFNEANPDVADFPGGNVNSVAL